jgi:large subunit ribosomal protein L35
MKTKKAVKKRFKKTGTGKLLRRSQGRSHLLSKKTSQRKNRLAKPKLVADSHKDKYLELMAAQ